MWGVVGVVEVIFKYSINFEFPHTCTSNTLFDRLWTDIVQEMDMPNNYQTSFHLIPRKSLHNFKLQLRQNAIRRVHPTEFIHQAMVTGSTLPLPLHRCGHVAAVPSLIPSVGSDGHLDHFQANHLCNINYFQRGDVQRELKLILCGVGMHGQECVCMHSPFNAGQQGCPNFFSNQVTCLDRWNTHMTADTDYKLICNTTLVFLYLTCINRFELHFNIPAT